jgi:endoglucanase
MRRGINLGNALEAPNEGEWGYRIETAHLDAIRGAGFDGVRLPVRWDAHAREAPPYALAPAFLARVDDVVHGAIERGLIVQLDSHHYDALINAPQRHRARFLALWRQIARHYADAPAGLMLEPFNEPHGDYWRGNRLVALQREVLSIIRESNPSRLVVLGPGNWNSIDGLRAWSPPADANLAVSVHYYEPHDFTHQRAEWLGASAPRFPRAWGTETDVAQVGDHIVQAARWGAQRGFAMQLGEFGVNRAVTPSQRALWTRTVRQACEASNMAWCAWDFAGAFPVWDREREAFIPEMLDALLR